MIDSPVTVLTACVWVPFESEVVTCTTVTIYDKVMPLRMKPRQGRYGSQEFETFVEGVFQPYFGSHPDPAAPGETELPVPEGPTPSPSEGLPASVKGVGSGGKPKSVRKSPRLRRSVSEIDLDEVKESSSGVLAKKPNPFSSSHCEVEKVVDTRVRKGVRQYKSL